MIQDRVETNLGQVQSKWMYRKISKSRIKLLVKLAAQRVVR